jgi:heat shock protein HslJ
MCCGKKPLQNNFKKNRITMLRIVILTTLILGIIACSSDKQENTVSSDDEPVNADAAHNSQNSLDWAGVYKGTIPCADCPGIETRIALKYDGTFERSVRYLEKEEGSFTDEGDFTWDETGSNITLTGENTQEYKVGENMLFHLDQEGNLISGDLAEKYQLFKNMTDTRLENKKWMLIEVMGQAVDTSSMGKEPFIQFDEETGRFSGNAGCNNFFGMYELMEGDRIQLGKAGSTLMACPDMSVEDQFMKVLEQVDNYSVSDSTLTLNRARMAPLARFGR